MNFNQVKKMAIACLKRGAYDHEVRKQLDIKNLFQCGQLSDDFVIDLIKRCSGKEYTVSPHHKAPSIDVHVLKPFKENKRWYVKFYFVEPDMVFISVQISGV